MITGLMQAYTFWLGGFTATPAVDVPARSASYGRPLTRRARLDPLLPVRPGDGPVVVRQLGAIGDALRERVRR